MCPLTVFSAPHYGIIGHMSRQTQRATNLSNSPYNKIHLAHKFVTVLDRVDNSPDKCNKEEQPQ